jgi:hypothetical protein
VASNISPTRDRTCELGTVFEGPSKGRPFEFESCPAGLLPVQDSNPPGPFESKYAAALYRPIRRRLSHQAIVAADLTSIWPVFNARTDFRGSSPKRNPPWKQALSAAGILLRLGLEATLKTRDDNRDSRFREPRHWRPVGGAAAPPGRRPAANNTAMRIGSPAGQLPGQNPKFPGRAGGPQGRGRCHGGRGPGRSESGRCQRPRRELRSVPGSRRPATVGSRGSYATSLATSFGPYGHWAGPTEVACSRRSRIRPGGRLKAAPP